MLHDCNCKNCSTAKMHDCKLWLCTTAKRRTMYTSISAVSIVHLRRPLSKACSKLLRNFYIPWRNEARFCGWMEHEQRTEILHRLQKSRLTYETGNLTDIIISRKELPITYRTSKMTCVCVCVRAWGKDGNLQTQLEEQKKAFNRLEYEKTQLERVRQERLRCFY